MNRLYLSLCIEGWSREDCHMKLHFLTDDLFLHVCCMYHIKEVKYQCYKLTITSFFLIQDYLKKIKNKNLGITNFCSFK